MKTKFLSILLAGVLLGTGCADIRPQKYPQMPPKKDRAAYQAAQAEMDRRWHGIWVPANTNVSLTTWDKLNPLSLAIGNADDPQPPADFMRDQCPFLRKMAWWGRNPLHNLFFYGIGVADKDFVRFGKYPESVGNPNGGWMFAITAYEYWRLPYVSYTGKRIQWYFGWRNHGNFGIKINAVKKKKEKDETPSPAKPRHESRGIFI